MSRNCATKETKCCCKKSLIFPLLHGNRHGQSVKTELSYSQQFCIYWALSYWLAMFIAV